VSSGIHFVKMPDEEFIRESIDIVKKAQDNGLVLRILGGVAVYIHTMDKPENLKIYERLRRFGEGNPTFTDLDLIGYSKQISKVEKFFERKLGFKPDFYINRIIGQRRLLFYHPKDYYHVDIFFDKLEFCHDVVFGSKPGKGRLELDFPTVSPADIVLEKLQIHEINLKDVIDLIVLFAFHEVKDTYERDVIDGGYIASILCDDWGFWYDAVTNLNKVKLLAEKFHNEGKLLDHEYNAVINNIDKLNRIIEETPKTKRWQKRAKMGTRKKWWRDVEEVSR